MNTIDILNRDNDVEKIFKIIDLISNKRGNASFAINGDWGSGKSFVLDILEEKLKTVQNEETVNNKFIIFHYDCWKYDYYEEPVLALVASMLDSIDKSVSVIDETKKELFVAALKELGEIFLSISNKVVENKIGISPKKIYNFFKKSKQRANDKIESKHAYDKYFEFNKTLEKLREELLKLSEQYTIVFVVDELDRCLPVYAIKVLERLHHITNQIENTITIIATDKTRLESIIQSTIGVEDINKYLKKFIQFEIQLSIGNPDDSIENKFKALFSLYDGDDKEEAFEYILEFLKGIEIRSIIQILNRLELVHRLLFSDKKDYSFLCMEVLVAVLLINNNYKTILSEVDRINADNFLTSPGGASAPVSKDLVSFIDNKVEKVYKGNWNEGTFNYLSITYVHLDKNISMYEKMAYYWCVFHGAHNISIEGSIAGEKKQLMENGKDLKEFVSMLEYIL